MPLGRTRKPTESDRMKETYYAISIHPFNRKMEFWHDPEHWHNRLSKDISPTVTSHDCRVGANCVWMILEDDD